MAHIIQQPTQYRKQNNQYKLSLLGKTYSGITYDDLVCLNYLFSQTKVRSTNTEKYISTLSAEAKEFYDVSRRITMPNSRLYYRAYRGRGRVNRQRKTMPLRAIQMQISSALSQAETTRSAKEDYNYLLEKLLPVE